MPQSSIGILAGINELPVLAAKKAQEQGKRSVVVALFPDNNPELKEYSDAYYPVAPSQLTEVIKAFQQEQVKEVCLLGKVSKEILYAGFQPDATWLSILQRVHNKTDDALLLAIVQEFARHGLEVLPQTTLLREMLVTPGVLTQSQPTLEQLQDIIFGYNQVKAIAGLDIGQTIVVSGQAVMAVEAIEGTNQAILRGGSLARRPVTVIKVAKPEQDARFDIPTIGYDTVESLAQAGGGLVAVEGNEVFFVGQRKALEYADANSISICAFNPDAARVGQVERLCKGE